MEDKVIKSASENALREDRAGMGSPKGAAKLPFEPPRLVVHGEVKELTAGTFGASV